MYDTKTFTAICKKADIAGKTAVEKLQVVPMVVGQETSLFSGVIDETKPTYYFLFYFLSTTHQVFQNSDLYIYTSYRLLF